MAKRAIISSYRNIYPLLRISPRLVASTHFLKPAVVDPRLARPDIDGFLYESRRFFAKSRKKWDDDDDGELGLANGDAAASRIEVVDIGPIIKQTAVSEMEAGIEAVSNELSKLRTGRASTGMLDHIMVETGEVKMPLNRMAAVSVLDPKTLSVTPYNPAVIISPRLLIPDVPFLVLKRNLLDTFCQSSSFVKWKFCEYDDYSQLKHFL